MAKPRSVEAKKRQQEWVLNNPKVNVRLSIAEVASMERIAAQAKMRPSAVASKLIRFALQTLVGKQQRGRFERELRGQGGESC